MARAVGTSLGSVTIDKRDEGAAALARRYAALMDAAQPTAVYAKHLAAVRAALDTLAVIDPVVGVDYEQAFTKIADALAAHSVASDLGPKLLAALTALGLTLAGRGAKGGAANDARGAPTPQSKADELRERRTRRAARARAGGAAAVDSAPAGADA